MVRDYLRAILASSSLSSNPDIAPPMRPRGVHLTRSLGNLGLGTASLALAASLSLSAVAPIEAAAMPAAPTVTVGSTIFNPRTGVEEVVTEIKSDSVVQTASGDLILITQTPGDSFVGVGGDTFEVVSVETADFGGTDRVVRLVVKNVTDPTKPNETVDVATQVIGGAAGTGSEALPFPDLADGANTNRFFVIRRGLDGQTGSLGTLFVPAGTGGAGATGPDVLATIGAGDTTATRLESPNVAALTYGSFGGNGGKGGDSVANLAGGGGAGGVGGNGGTVIIDILPGRTISTAADGLHGVFVQSAAGAGGAGGTSALTTGGGGPGGAPGSGGLAQLTSAATINTTGDDAHGIFVQSVGGTGGNGGLGFLSIVGGGAGTGGGNGGTARVVHSGRVQTSGRSAFGVLVQSIGGAGGYGGTSDTTVVSLGNDGGGGGSGGTASLEARAGSVTLTSGDGSVGLFAQSVGGGGGISGRSASLVSLGSTGGVGGNGGAVEVAIGTGATVGTAGLAADAVVAQSIGGGGGFGAFGASLGRNLVLGSTGGAGGRGGNVSASNAGIISTVGDDARGIFAQSVGGGGGSAGGTAGTLAFGGGAAGGGGDGAIVAVTQSETGSIATVGDGSTALLAQSIGGGGGSGGFNLSIASMGGEGGTGGNGGAITVANAGVLQTGGDEAHGIFAQSVGGGGGSGGFAGSLAVSLGGSGGGGGDGGAVSVTHSGTINTGFGGGSGDSSRGILAQSVGGGGGHAGGAGVLSLIGSLALGGNGGGGGRGGDVALTFLPATQAGPGGIVNVAPSVITTGDSATAIAAQSVGGGGGNGGISGTLTLGAGLAAAIAVGGNGGNGGAGGNVTLNGDVRVRTSGDNSYGIDAQSIGGGGGNGGMTGSVVLAGGGISLAASVGGTGGLASNGGTVSYVGDVDIETAGLQSYGLSLQSIGGGGGRGGFSGSLNLAAGPLLNASLALGGSGGGGGDGGLVQLDSGGRVVTTGDSAIGVNVQSIGGGGGSGGVVFSLAGGVNLGSVAAVGATVAAGVGGSGGAGGNGGAVSATFDGTVATSGDRSIGVFLQSTGGGGGDGGFAVAVAGQISSGTSAAISAGIGGSGGEGGDGGSVNGTVTRTVTTEGEDAAGVIIQSVGGGGGIGGGTVTLAGATGFNAAAIAVGVGGSGGGGGDGGGVSGLARGPITTLGDNSDGFFVQSVGGGGGKGGFSFVTSAAVGGLFSSASSVSIGGSGGEGGNGGDVTGTAEGLVQTSGNGSRGVVVQSVGGGGGDGDFSFALGGSGSLSLTAVATSVGIGGNGEGGGSGGTVNARAGAIRTFGDDADAFIAQSVGGGGGTGGVNVAGSIAASPTTGISTTIGLGGTGADGGNGGAVTARVTGDVLTQGLRSRGVLAQSVGGGGGAGGVNVSGAANFAISFASSVSVGIGGAGGGGGDGGRVDLEARSISTSGDDASAFIAHSVGGGGGIGGGNVSGSQASTSGPGFNASISVGVGGSGGGGGSGSDVTGAVVGNLSTQGRASDGALVQSIGGGGGAGGFNVSGAFSASLTNGGSVSVGVGGSGGGGGNAGNVSYVQAGASTTQGDGSRAIFVQSAGGGGGTGGFSVSGGASINFGVGGSVAVGIGGSGGKGGNAGNANVEVNRGQATDDPALLAAFTAGDEATAITAQSVGGGGGAGGFNVSGSLAVGIAAGNLSVGIGGSGGDGGSAAGASADITGTVATMGDKSTGIFVQSAGGGGGNGAFNVGGTINASAVGGTVSVGIGGSGGGGGNAGSAALVARSQVLTEGDDADGIFVQSVGGGGGNGGFNVSGSLQGSVVASAALAVGVGGTGGGGGNGGEVTVRATGPIRTLGDRSRGLFAQSTGGGGGNGGFNFSGAVTANVGVAGKTSTGIGIAIGIGVGGMGGLGGNGGNVTASSGSIMTSGEEATAFMAQSTGGGGGNGAFNVSGGIGLAALGASASVGIGVGGFGGAGGNGAAVDASVQGDILTNGRGSHGIFVSSAGGGGGNGGFNVSGGVTLSTSGQAASISLGIGGFGGGGGNAGMARLVQQGEIITRGEQSLGALVQSVGGSGGNGAFNVSGSIALSAEGSAALGLGIGGFGGGGGNASAVTAELEGLIETLGRGSTGVMIQSVGGGGGNGSFNVNGGLAYGFEGTNTAAGIGIGGFGGNGGTGSAVTASITGSVMARDNASGVVAQSIGGGGGNGSFNVTAQLAFGVPAPSGGPTPPLPGISGAPSASAASTAGSGGNAKRIEGLAEIAQSGPPQLTGPSGGTGQVASIGVGGFGGTGGNAADVTLTLERRAGIADAIIGNGDNKYAVLAQSVGGGGGSGGFNFAGGLSTNGTLGVGIGGFGGGGGTGGNVRVNSAIDLRADGLNSAGLLAQSIGGGGGAGGLNLTGSIVAATSDTKPAIGFGLGGAGGAGNRAGEVTGAHSGLVVVTGESARGIVAQSIGGGGGVGGLNVTTVITRSEDENGVAAAIGIGGFGGTGADAGAVDFATDGTILVNTTVDADGMLVAANDKNGGAGVIAQSIGGGGGTGGFNLTGVIAPAANPVAIGVGGAGGAAGNGAAVTLRHGLATGSDSLIAVHGDNAYGLLAQSIGGGGGNGGYNLVFAQSEGPEGDHPFALAVAVGGSGASGGDAGTVTVSHDGMILTRGVNSAGLVAQSIAGGGGNAAINRLAGETADVTGLNVLVGGGTGDGGTAGAVKVTQQGMIVTSGNRATGLRAQSIGGGGGNVDDNENELGGASGGLTLQIGRVGGTGGVGGAVEVLQQGTISTSGMMANAIVAQSIGGGGGTSGSIRIGGNTSVGSGVLARSYSVAMDIGQQGGSGATGGSVEVVNEGNLFTTGAFSRGILAQSIGGGGGEAGSAATETGGADTNIGMALGGKGGTGAAAGRVEVRNSGIISTSGASADGITAQSIGGSGGLAGSTTTTITEPGSDLIPRRNSVTMALGGQGGTGATGGAVQVINSGDIQTLGEAAFGIRAQSIGGGGGQGGASVTETGDEGKLLTGSAFLMSMGGAGGTGGAGDSVMVTNTGRILTFGARAVGLAAQSIGGGGGDAGMVQALGGFGDLQGLQLGMNIGGTGGTGGVAGDVVVLNRLSATDVGTIVTRGDDAHGIVAQSIAGGGGNGSLVIVAAPTSGLGIGNPSINIGGNGGSGNDAGNVLVINDGLIGTFGERAYGILAQSVGGGGGNGLAVNLPRLDVVQGTVARLLSVGGTGGAGGLSGKVEVINNGGIVTFGTMAHGIVAEAIDGGGGRADLILDSADASLIAGQVEFGLGASQAVAAGPSDNVTVTNRGQILVSGLGAKAIHTQMITGGGGSVFADLGTLAGFLPATGSGTGDPRIAIKQGSVDSDGQRAADLAIDHEGQIQSTGRFGVGGFSQSIGGGGGDGQYRFALAADADLPAGSNGQRAALDVALALGASGSSGSAGGSITASYVGTVLTTGFGSPGQLIQSIGGGGGRAILDIAAPGAAAAARVRTASLGPYGAVTVAAAAGSPTADITAQLGGTGSAVSPGGAIAFDQVGIIATTADLSPGAVLQSIGGGGGSATISVTGSGAGGLALDAGLGATGGALSNGGAIIAGFSGGILAQGELSPALVVQSIGGGGGLLIAGGLEAGRVSLGASDGAGGDGGAIDLVNIGDILTDGAAAPGVILQSIGGGGGAVLGAGAGTDIALSGAATGSGAGISFVQTGDIVTAGNGASAVIVQSLGGGGGYIDGIFSGTAGGEGAGGAITVTLDGTIASLGADATAVVLQSAGSSGAGPIALTIAEGGMVFAGNGGTAIAFDGGSDNLFDNYGSVTTADGIAGTFMRAGSGDDAIRNSGMLVGNVILGSGANSLVNLLGATILTGTMADLGDSANLFSNAGTLAPGGTDSIVTTALGGSFTQSATGATFLEVDLSGDRHDAINATGRISLAGSVDARLLNVISFTPGMKNYEIFTGAAGTSVGGVDLRADSSVVLNLLGLRTTANAVELQYDMTFAPAIAVGNQRELGLYLDRVQTVGVPAAIQPTFTQLVFEQSPEVYADFLTQLGADFYAEQNAVAIERMFEFDRLMDNCGSRPAALTEDDTKGCAWAEVTQSGGTRDALPGSPANTSDLTSFSGGAHYRLAEQFSVALAVGYNDIALDGNRKLWGASGEGIQIGFGAGYHTGATRISAYASYGRFRYDTLRELPGFAAAVTSRRELDAFNAQIGARHRFDMGGLTVEPGLGFGLTSLADGTTGEAGAPALELAIGKSSGTYTWVMPELSLAYDGAISDSWWVRPYANLALRQYLSGSDVSVSARFVGDTTSVDPFLARTPLGETGFVGTAGLEFFNKSGIRVGVAYTLDHTEFRERDSFAANLSIRF